MIAGLENTAGAKLRFARACLLDDKRRCNGAKNIFSSTPRKPSKPSSPSWKAASTWATFEPEAAPVELIGAKIDAIKKAEDRLLFKDAMRKIGLETPESQLVNSLERGQEFAARIGFPCILRPSFTLGGTGGGIAYNKEDLDEILERGLALSPVHEVLIEESALGWKEFELEVMRDLADNCIIICSIENFDAMGVHTGDSVTVAPAQTLTDREYQMMRDAAIACLREIGVDTGGSNVQFAINPANGRMVIITTTAFCNSASSKAACSAFSGSEGSGES